jgi:hypothetical protein
MADGSHGGRPSSWFAVGVLIAGFAVGGLGLVFGPTWWVFWLGIAIVAVGGVLALAVGIFSDVVVDAPRDIAVAPAGPDSDAVETQAVKTEPTGSEA